MFPTNLVILEYIEQTSFTAPNILYAVDLYIFLALDFVSDFRTRLHFCIPSIQENTHQMEDPQ